MKTATMMRAALATLMMVTILVMVTIAVTVASIATAAQPIVGEPGDDSKMTDTANQIEFSWKVDDLKPVTGATSAVGSADR
jgi:hypothetical protein